MHATLAPDRTSPFTVLPNPLFQRTDALWSAQRLFWGERASLLEGTLTAAVASSLEAYAQVLFWVLEPIKLECTTAAWQALF